MEYFELANGQKIPKIGLGTYDIMDEDVIRDAILEGGYRLIDTAQFTIMRLLLVEVYKKQ